MTDDVPQRIAELLGEALDRDPDDVAPGQRLVEDLGADSLAMIEVVIAVAQAFGVTIPETDVAGLATVADLTAYVEQRAA